MARKIGFKSYCWSIGTTSYRTDNFNMSIEKQLELLSQFRAMDKNKGCKWENNKGLQEDYYFYLKENDFVKGEAKRPDKDAREKTSGLRDIGLLDDDRNITEAGLELLKIAESEDFSPDNLLEIPKDSFLYFKQMLKTANTVEGRTVRPFVVFLYVVNELEYLTNEEFTYLLPLCIDDETTKNIVERIRAYRRLGEENFDDIISAVLMEKDNYRQALELLKTEPVSEELICDVGINRKSANYDRPYYSLYTLLERIVFGRDNVVTEFYKATQKLGNTKVGGAWRKYFFRSSGLKAIGKRGLSALNEVPILQSTTEKEFKEEFFRIMHVFKAKATLGDYFDLNRRYFKITDTVLFQDNKVKLDILPKCYVEIAGDKLLSIAFQQTELLPKNAPLKDIGDFLDVDAESLYEKLGVNLGIRVAGREDAQRVIKDGRYERFNSLIDEKFDKETLIRLLECFENRDDDVIRSLVTDNADIPTIFEYILAVAWYVISERKGDVLEYMNLSLEADLLPKTHAGGGEADIVWKYEETPRYPKHTLLIEATLADRSNQRRMEMEPVSRHLGDYRLAHKDEEAYCLFITTFLNNNVISDFRARRFMEYYNSSGTEYITGMKILPVETSQLKNLLQADVKYSQIYDLMEQAYVKEGAPKEWYENNIVKEIQNVKTRRH